MLKIDENSVSVDDSKGDTNHSELASHLLPVPTDPALTTAKQDDTGSFSGHRLFVQVLSNSPSLAPAGLHSRSSAPIMSSLTESGQGASWVLMSQSCGTVQLYLNKKLCAMWALMSHSYGTVRLSPKNLLYVMLGLGFLLWGVSLCKFYFGFLGAACPVKKEQQTDEQHSEESDTEPEKPERGHLDHSGHFDENEDSEGRRLKFYKRTKFRMKRDGVFQVMWTSDSDNEDCNNKPS